MAALIPSNRAAPGRRDRRELRDQQRLERGPLKEYSQYGQNIPFGDATPRAGNDSGGGQPGWILKCKGWETDQNAYV